MGWFVTFLVFGEFLLMRNTFVFRKIARRTIPKVYNEKHKMSLLDRPNYLQHMQQ